MSRIPCPDLSAFRRIESHFDGAYCSLLDKLGHLKLSSEQVLQQVRQEPANDTNGQGYCKEEEEDIPSETDSGEAYQSEPDEFEAFELDLVEPELITLALSFAKLMTKSLLAVERAADLERQVGQLQRENCTLRAIATNCHQLCLSSKGHGHSESHKSKAVNLIAFKAAIEQEIDALIENQNRTMARLQDKYKNQLYGLTLAVDYLKKELSGRVQQQQILSKLLQDNGFNQSKIHDNPSLYKIWNQILCEIALNRHKTIARLSEKASQDREDEESKEANEESKEDSTGPMDSLCSLLITGCPQTGPKLIDFTKLGQVRFVSLYMEKNQPLGLWINGGSERHMPLVIHRVLPDSVAEKSGQLCPGDIVLSIQDFDMIGTTQTYAAQLLRSIAGWCRLGIVRIPVTDVAGRLAKQDNFELLFDNFASDQSEPHQKQESEEKVTTSDSEQSESDSKTGSISSSSSSSGSERH